MPRNHWLRPSKQATHLFLRQPDSFAVRLHLKTDIIRTLVNYNLFFHIRLVSDVFLGAAEVDVELVERGEERAERRAAGHLREGVDVLRKALAAVAALAVRPGHVGVHVVDVAGEQHARVDLRPVAAHFLNVLLRRVEIRDLVRAEDVVEVLRELRLERTHHRELLAGEHLDQEIDRPREHHRLLLEVLDVRALGEELGHVADLVPGLLREPVARPREDRGAHEHGHVGKSADELLHERKVLRTIVFGGHVDLQEGDVDLREVVIEPLRRVAHEDLALLVVFLQPGLQRPADEAASDYADFNHFLSFCWGDFLTTEYFYNHGIHGIHGKYSIRRLYDKSR